MLTRLVDFAEALRGVGIPVSLTETLDAARVLSLLGPRSREELRCFLSTTLVKNSDHLEIFASLFAIFFAPDPRSPVELCSQNSDDVNASGILMPDDEGLFDTARTTLLEFQQEIVDAMVENDLIRLKVLAANSVAHYSKFEPGKSLSGRYFVHRTLSELNLDALLVLLQQRLKSKYPDDEISGVIMAQVADSKVLQFQGMIEEQIVSLMAIDQGIHRMARLARLSLPEDIDFLRASRAEIDLMRKQIAPLALKFATRLGRRAKRTRRGTLDFRKTFRDSIGYGGVPLRLTYRKPRLIKPEIFVLADLSGSVSSFSAFALQLLFALTQQFSRVRSFVFVNTIDEVTSLMALSYESKDLVGLVSSKASIIDIDGHTNYGTSFEGFGNRFSADVTRRSTVVILGDARNNYHNPRAELLKELKIKAHALYWLNPEPSLYWNSGDSVMAEYAKYCDDVVECRNLRQLGDFVKRVVPT